MCRLFCIHSKQGAGNFAEIDLTLDLAKILVAPKRIWNLFYFSWLVSFKNEIINNENWKCD